MSSTGIGMFRALALLSSRVKWASSSLFRPENDLIIVVRFKIINAILLEKKILNKIIFE